MTTLGRGVSSSALDIRKSDIVVERHCRFTIETSFPNQGRTSSAVTNGLLNSRLTIRSMLPWNSRPSPVPPAAPFITVYRSDIRLKKPGLVSTEIYIVDLEGPSISDCSAAPTVTTHEATHPLTPLVGSTSYHPLTSPAIARTGK